ncbi:unnamed protein product [Prorocentrum cordatum]|uniref:PDZ domain-containing protein n=1 Tax=Prorocentrum cordatum TaxID=2364126 RepID=A0ABN9PP63_9DINO|nr:unnamed protein product [Polarella glacialis]
MGNCAESPSTETKEVATSGVFAADGEGSAAEPSPSIFTVKFEKDPSDKLGLDISHSVDRTHLMVRRVKDGHFERWNKANPDKMVESGDMLIAIDDVKGNSVRMLQFLMRAASSVEFVFQKPVPP